MQKNLISTSKLSRQQGKIKLSLIVLCLGVITLLFSGFSLVSSYNNLQTVDEHVNQNWSEVLNQYQRRFDLIPNLVATVERYADHEKALLIEITQMRGQIGQLQAKLQNNPDDASLQLQFQEQQTQMGGLLSRMIVVTENYPELQSSQLFKDLMIQLEGTENRITVARMRYIEAVTNYNLQVRRFPSVLIANAIGMSPKNNFTTSDPSAQLPVKVNFSQN